MRIETPDKIAPASLKGKRKARPSGAASEFPIEQTDTSDSVHVPTATAPSASLDAILTLQDVNSEESRKQTRIAVDYGEKLLGKLRELHELMLNDGLTKNNIDQLQTLLRFAQPTTDPHLRRILDEIELRAKVEIAKHRFDRTS